MVRCKRCGASFEYEKRDGVCPKCCFYNRPPGALEPDNSWMGDYNIDNNSYVPPRLSSEDVLEGRHDRGWKRDSYHEERLREQKKKKKSQNERKQKEKQREKSQQRQQKKTVDKKPSGKKSRKGGCGCLIALLMVIIVIYSCMMYLLSEDHLESIKNEMVGQPAGQELYSVWSVMPEEAADGVQAGDIIYQVGEVRELFGPGELPELPAGEKCIGIWISDDEFGLNYNGSDWCRPYVHDGVNFREMVSVDGLESEELFGQKGVEYFPVYSVGYEDISAYAVFFVREDAQSVVLSLPCQFVTGKNRDQVEYTQNAEVELPIEALQ